ncbi:DUF1778 domain-containing protein [Oryzifoliimicrobium ureilyticus]|uniref:type II toxin-antitoxin system TacA family antitoxin n=1 Tax=Oryzifoliimicrobium ureilyticus TaxID=3113724 RepID=UPI003F66C731
MVSLHEIALGHRSYFGRRHANKSVNASDSLDIRIKAAACNPIDRAVALLGKTRTGFMFEACERRAEEVLLDRTVFALGPEVYTGYLARLDAPAQANERLKRTISTKAPRDDA